MTESKEKGFQIAFPARVLIDDLEPGQTAVVSARAGVGKSAVLIQAALAYLFRGGEVLHISAGGKVRHVKRAYDDILHVLNDKIGQDACPDSMLMSVDRSRHIHCCKDRVFSATGLMRTMSFLQDSFRPSAVILDSMDLKRMGGKALAELKHSAAENGFVLWFSALSHRDDPAPEKGCLPVPLDETEELWDSVFVLKPVTGRTALKCLKRGGRSVASFGGEVSDGDDDGIFLDPITNIVVLHR